MLKQLGDKYPQIHPSAYISETAYIAGDVEIGEESSVWPGVVIRGDYGSIKIGKRTNIQDNAVLHADDYLIVGDDVTIGHSAVVHCHKIGNDTLIGINSTVLGDAEIGDNCLVAAGSVVLEGTMVPNDSLVVGIPGKISNIKKELKSRVLQSAINYRQNAKRYKHLQ